jgi:hypothetical protein
MRHWLLAVAALLAVGGCEDDDGVGQSTGSGAGSTTPSSSSSKMTTDCGDAADAALSGNCRDCALSGCCAELAACETEACDLRLACEVACNDDAACLGDCATMYPDGEAASAVVACLNQSCEVCAAPTAVCGTDLSVGSPSCDACIDMSCCTEVDACIADGDCRVCVESGEPDLCQNNTVYADTISCFDAMCGTPCGG